MNTIIKLDNYEELNNGLKGYDTAVIIYNVPKFPDGLTKKEMIYFDYVKYIDITLVDSEIPNKLHYLYYKKKIHKKSLDFLV